MRFALSYSCGKDSTLALHKLIAAGHEPLCLITMFRPDQHRSWFHGANHAMLSAYERALGLPLHACEAKGEDYAKSFERALTKAAASGAEACAFGDIDLEQNRLWEEARCANSGLTALFPLWNLPRRQILSELLDLGYKCLIKTINTSRLEHMPQAKVANLCEKYLGQYLSPDFLSEIESLGMDACGENGEYHTLAVDGPIFKQPLAFRPGKLLKLPGQTTVEISFQG